MGSSTSSPVVHQPALLFQRPFRRRASPQSLAPAVERGTLLRAFAAVAGDRFVCIPLVVKAPLNFTATFPMRFVVYDGDITAEVETKELNTGETYVLPPRLARVIVGGGR